MKIIKTTKTFCKDLNTFFKNNWLPKSRLMPHEWEIINDFTVQTGINDWTFVVFDPEEFPNNEKEKHTFFPIGKEKFGVVLSGAPEPDEAVFNLLHHIAGTMVLKRSA